METSVAPNRDGDSPQTYSILSYLFENEDFDVYLLKIKYLASFIVPIFCVFGMAGNCMALMLIRTNFWLRRLTSNAYLSTLSVSSCLFLFTVFVTWMDNQHNVPLYNNSEIGCKIFTYLAHACDFICVWMISWVSCDRIIVLYRPGIRKWVCTKKFSRRMVLCTILISLTFYSWCLISASLEMEGKQVFCGLARNQTFFGKTIGNLYFIFTLLDTMLCTILPSILIVVMNSFAIYRYHQCMKIYASGVLRVRFLRTPDTLNNNDYEETTAKKLLLSQATPTTNAASTQSARGAPCGKMRSSDLQLSRTLLVVTSTFVLLNVPNYALRICQEIFVSNNNVMFHLVYFATYLLYYFHHAVLFYFYIFWSPQMKKQLKPAAMRLLEYLVHSMKRSPGKSVLGNKFKRMPPPRPGKLEPNPRIEPKSLVDYYSRSGQDSPTSSTFSSSSSLKENQIPAKVIEPKTIKDRLNRLTQSPKKSPIKTKTKSVRRRKLILPIKRVSNGKLLHPIGQLESEVDELRDFDELWRLNDDRFRLSSPLFRKNSHKKLNLGLQSLRQRLKNRNHKNQHKQKEANVERSIRRVKVQKLENSPKNLLVSMDLEYVKSTYEGKWISMEAFLVEISSGRAIHRSLGHHSVPTKCDDRPCYLEFDVDLRNFTEKSSLFVAFVADLAVTEKKSRRSLSTSDNFTYIKQSIGALCLGEFCRQQNEFLLNFAFRGEEVSLKSLGDFPKNWMSNLETLQMLGQISKKEKSSKPLDFCVLLLKTSNEYEGETLKKKKTINSRANQQVKKRQDLKYFLRFGDSLQEWKRISGFYSPFNSFPREFSSISNLIDHLNCQTSFKFKAIDQTDFQTDESFGIEIFTNRCTQLSPLKVEKRGRKESPVERVIEGKRLHKFEQPSLRDTFPHYKVAHNVEEKFVTIDNSMHWLGKEMLMNLHNVSDINVHERTFITMWNAYFRMNSRCTFGNKDVFRNLIGFRHELYSCLLNDKNEAFIDFQLIWLLFLRRLTENKIISPLQEAVLITGNFDLLSGGDEERLNGDVIRIENDSFEIPHTLSTPMSMEKTTPSKSSSSSSVSTPKKRLLKSAEKKLAYQNQEKLYPLRNSLTPSRKSPAKSALKRPKSAVSESPAKRTRSSDVQVHLSTQKPSPRAKNSFFTQNLQNKRTCH
ncbi:unnamed protein product, partial [Mesorhabditis belari]|uniref:G-protein coupled receptors family 1 profile domain-containing protein n=1 Tax=Mesorhabditis belari TaxID=2138241 RepID=A0AAF3EJT5_9BILA